MTLLGAILAGGRSSRFGSDKALASLGGTPLIMHVARLIAPFVTATVICGRRQPIEGLQTVPDWPQPDLGPLGGLCGALRHATTHGYRGVISIGCDMPVLPSGLIERLVATGGAAYIAEAPILGCWPAVLGDGLGHHLSQDGDRSIRGWARAVGASPVEAGAALANLNRPEDLAELQASIQPRHAGKD